MTLVLRFDIKTVSEANQRENWRVRHTRKKSQQRDFALLWRSNMRGRQPVRNLAGITFTRFSCKTLDADNLAGSFKHVQDALAKELGVDDANVDWGYRQVKTPTREHYFLVTINEDS